MQVGHGSDCEYWISQTFCLIYCTWTLSGLDYIIGLFYFNLQCRYLVLYCRSSHLVVPCMSQCPHSVFSLFIFLYCVTCSSMVTVNILLLILDDLQGEFRTFIVWHRCDKRCVHRIFGRSSVWSDFLQLKCICLAFLQSLDFILEELLIFVFQVTSFLNAPCTYDGLNVLIIM